MRELPPPRDLEQLPGALIAELSSLVPDAEAAAWCADLLAGADPSTYRTLLPYLAGHPGAGYLDGSWADYWPRVWGARGLLYVWDEPVAPAVLDGLDDPAWRVAEMCLKVAVKRSLPGADGALALAGHELARVRVAAMRLLGAAGDTEHVGAVQAASDDPAPEVRRAAGRALEQLATRLDLPPDRRP